TVEEVKEDPLLGKVVILSHEADVSSYYASLGEVDVEEGKKINQGDNLGISGKNLFSEESGNHVHFELRKDDEQANPEDFFTESMATGVDLEPNEEEDEQAADEEEESTEEPADESNGEEELDPFEEPAEDPSEETDEEESEEDEDEVDDEEEDASLQDVSFYMTT